MRSLFARPGSRATAASDPTHTDLRGPSPAASFGTSSADPADPHGLGRTALLARVRSTLFVASRRRSRSLLDGEYASVFHGRSVDYDDLREYVAGDEVRDIDWKATARHGSALVRRYTATRKQHIMFVVDTGRALAATTASGETKKSVAVLVCGLVGELALRHGDLVGLVHGNVGQTAGGRLRGTESHLELILRQIDDSAQLGARVSDLTHQLQWVVRNIRRRLVLVVVSDERPFDEQVEALVRRLHVQHEILWVTIEDADPTLVEADAEVFDVGDDYTIPAPVRSSPEVRRAHTAAVAARREHTEAVLNRHGIVSARLGSSEQVVPAMFSMLARQRRAR